MKDIASIKMGINSPGPAEVIRSCQRDNEFIKRLKREIDQMILEVFGKDISNWDLFHI